MQKRIFSLFLAALLSLSSAVFVMAAKLENEADTANKNVYGWGHLDQQADVDHFWFSDYTGGDLALETEKQKEGTGCLKANLYQDIWNDIGCPAQLVVGETYDISFDYKAQIAGNALTLIFSSTQGGGSVTIGTGTYGTEWQTFKTTWTNTGTYGGKTASGGLGNFLFRHGSTAKIKNTIYIDNLSVVPHGKVDYHYAEMADKEEIYVSAKLAEEPKVTEKVTFSDMETSWAKNTVNTLATYGYVQGVGDGKFEPERNVTRAEFVNMMISSLGLAKRAYANTFTDIKGDEWYADVIESAYQLGLLDSALIIGNQFKPNVPINREEAASVSARAAKIKNAQPIETAASFTDMEASQDWAKQAVSDAASLGIIYGYENGTFLPKNNITRAEASAILLRVVELNERFGIYVDGKTGDDKNPGTLNRPLKTIYAAQEMVRSYNKDMKHDLTVYIRGEQFLDKPLEMDNRDSGSNGYKIEYTSWDESEQAVLSGGKDYTGFTLHDRDKNIYKTYVGTGVKARQAYFNDRKGIRARNVGGLENTEEISVAEDGSYYYLTDDKSLLDCPYPTEIEMRYNMSWLDFRIFVGGIYEAENDMVRVNLHPDYTAYMKEKITRWPNKKAEKMPVFLENAYEFLDAEGEWYLNHHDGYMYYIPREGENMETMCLTVPVAENALRISGESGFKPVSHITFSNLEFCNFGWNRPFDDGGIKIGQNYTYSFNGSSYNEDAPGNIEVKNAWYVNFLNSDFTRMGAPRALILEDAIHYCNVLGNEFYDLAGGAVAVGNVCGNPRERLPELYEEYNRVENNYIHDITDDYKSAAAVTLGYVRNTTVNHNIIANTGYTGIHTGWGWGGSVGRGTDCYNIEIGYNLAEEIQNDRIFDGGAHYHVGSQNNRLSPETNSRVIGNHFRNQRNVYGPLYLDNGSRWWTVSDNVIDQKDVLVQESNFDQTYQYEDRQLWTTCYFSNITDNTYSNNYSTVKRSDVNANNTFEEAHLYPDADWPEEAQKIIENAGIEDAYKGNFDLEGPKYFILRQKDYTVDFGKEVKINMSVQGIGGKEYDLKDFDIKFYSSNPDALEITEDGVMRATGNDLVWVMAVANVGNTTQVRPIRVLAGNGTVDIETTQASYTMISGISMPLVFNAVTGAGQRKELKPEEYTISAISTDESVATVDENGKIFGLKAGETVIEATVTYDGVTKTVKVPITIMSYSQEDSEELPFTPVDDTFFDPSYWQGATKNADGSITVGNSNLVRYWTGKITSGLIAFDMEITNPSSWPSFTFGERDQAKDYQLGSQYLIGFKADQIEFQRFDVGKRTMIFGDVSFNPVAGPGVPNVEGAKIFEYGKKYSIITGMIDEPGGTRIVLTINGKNIFDYLDTSDKSLRAGGSFGVYNTGQFTFSPYTGITE